MFERARAAGLPMPGGVDFYVTSAVHRVRAHYWTADDLDDRHLSSVRLPTGDKKINFSTIVIMPGFTEFCEKYSQVILRLHQWGHNVLIIDWPGQGLSGHLGSPALAVHSDEFADYLESFFR